jgi:hypothetical protein
MVRVSDGEVIMDTTNMVVTPGLDAIVNALTTTAYINTFKYIAFGTNNTGTTSGQAALGAELSGGTYARLAATQGVGGNNQTYQLTGTWTNNSSSNPATVTEAGIFSASTTGTMLARACTADAGGPATKTVATGDKIEVTWTILFEHA